MLAGVEHFLQRSPRNVFHHQIRNVVQFADAVDGHDVFMTQGGGESSLQGETLPGLGALCQFGSQNLQGDVTAQGRIVGLDDDSHGSLPDHAIGFIWPNVDAYLFRRGEQFKELLGRNRLDSRPRVSFLDPSEFLKSCSAGRSWPSNC